jgi:hypothetical protein
MRLASRNAVAVALLVALAGCGGSARTRGAPSESPSAAPRALPRWLVLTPGAMMRLAGDHADATHALVSATLGGVRKRFAVGLQPNDAKRPADEVVTVVRTGPALFEDPGSDTAVVIRSQHGWSGWVEGESQLQPIVPHGTMLAQVPASGNGDLVRYWRRQSDPFEEGIPLDSDVRFEFLDFVPNPGNAEYHVRIANGAHQGEVGFVMSQGLATSEGRPLQPMLAVPLSQPW